ncbi:hypothetical protein JQC92_15135 [Shewanella sp. 202IG2-18]|uniref:hypothetical protein n=1 Tax=Parashewanella hymeniacidonis TaxID=2807618 RepID=UPI00196024A6|nr:hypothetical protein [Parashewanella hymeniacidonis]MBM7073348.1 hypothetical protein [Parashewanella hymeniacidonis]
MSVNTISHQALRADFQPAAFNGEILTEAESEALEFGGKNYRKKEGDQHNQIFAGILVAPFFEQEGTEEALNLALASMEDFFGSELVDPKATVWDAAELKNNSGFSRKMSEFMTSESQHKLRVFTALGRG